MDKWLALVLITFFASLGVTQVAYETSKAKAATLPDKFELQLQTKSKGTFRLQCANYATQVICIE